ncbi:heptaprenyl diphosphate synthase component II [Anaerobacillus arseniciselenatis]|uniref:Heptaprenyl diphosphate synthase component 2 n=1 Tax=Anaerobacillus arseniciselenatis TaxID=85682 RepID=A0A1S2LUL5_9BACI|nr:heptaprenyl diphosphate synthase component II [Anaerobacillus arseniciselenatis]OIJ15853.1 heptaprenyl diphosphate synthase component II [Anaerobacillus arseniciselenatis]
MKLTDIYWHLRSDISKIEKELEATVDAKHPILKKASSHLLKAGGKRIRPVFVLLAAKFGNYDIEKVKQVAVPLELIHMASLVHDDVIDDADLRRGKKTIKSKWDNRVAMYTGDYIFARAIEMTTNCNKPEVHQILSDAMVEMCIGEVEQIRDQYNWNQNFRIYLRRIKRKTALLIAVSCRLGALAADAPRDVQLSLYRYGYNVGMAFQITDDILDFVATEKELGKPAGSDLHQGNVTLPALYSMEHDEELRSFIMKMIKGDKPDKKVMKVIIDKIKASGGVDYSLEVSDRYLNKAYKELENLPDIPAKDSFYQIAQYIGKRKF